MSVKLVVLLYFLIQSIGIYLFSSGFFTIREQLPNKSYDTFLDKG